MKVIAVATLRKFLARHPDAEQPLKAWHDEAARADWKQPAHIKAQYRSASILKNRRVVFNIRGNDYRLIVAVAYKIGVVYVKCVGTHAQYDAIDAETGEIDCMMNIKPIHSRAGHKAALKLISKLVDLDPAPSTPEGDMLEVMSTLIAAYEARHFPIGPADPIEAIKFRMDQQGLSVADLEPMIGRRNRVYEVLARSRPLTLAMIRRLHDGLGIPAESLIRPMIPGA